MKKYLLLLALAAVCAAGCGKNTTDPIAPEDPTDTDTDTDSLTYLYVNSFAYSTMKTYYLWEAEISAAFASWKNDD